jgi:hypothetical protein
VSKRHTNIGLEWVGKGGDGMERINGVKVFNVVFQDEQEEIMKEIGFIDYYDYRYNRSGEHKFAFIALKDWERVIIRPCLPDGDLSEGGVKVNESQISTIKIMLKDAVMNDVKIDIVVERRNSGGTQRHDYLIAVNSIKAFGY